MAGATAGLTAEVSEISGSNDAIRAENAANAVGSATPIETQIQIALAQSAINGDSFEETLKHQGVNILIGAVGNLRAKAIGNAAHGSITANADGTFTYHAPTIDKTRQLALHAELGCGMGLAGGNDCGSGAVSGMVGEEIGSYAYKNLNLNKQTSVQLAGLGGGLSVILTGNAIGMDDSEVADNIFSGQRIGGNAAENNAYFALRPLKGSPWLGALSHNKIDDNANTEVAHEQLFFEDVQGGNI
jgi:hypothetical protein